MLLFGAVVFVVTDKGTFEIKSDFDDVQIVLSKGGEEFTVIDLQTDSKGNFYFAKAGQYTQHHRPGTIMRIPPEGGRTEVIAW